MNPNFDLRHWQQLGLLRPIDVALAELILSRSPAPASVGLAIALCSQRTGLGHVCLDLKSMLAQPLSHWLAELSAAPSEVTAARKHVLSQLQSSSLASWWAELAKAEAIALAPEASNSQANRPLVLGGSSERPLLYLRRYWQYEHSIGQQLAQRLAFKPGLGPDFASLLAQLFTSTDAAIDWQQVACCLAASSGFAVITGGPGTGKTTTVVKLLALLQGNQLLSQLPPLRIHLAAPTGKAAARLQESIAGAIHQLPLASLPSAQAQAIRDQIPKRVSTLHRLLGPIAQSKAFRHHSGNPLLSDLVVVDEASMIDIEIMASLVQALRPSCRLILLGDKDQLASVEAGAVLGDLCHNAEQGNYWPETAAWLQSHTQSSLPARFQNPQGSALSQSITMLRHSYRFSQQGGIGALALLINQPTPAQKHEPLAALQQLIDDNPEQLLWQTPESPSCPQLRQQLLAGYRPYLQWMHSQRPSENAAAEHWDAWALGCLQAYGQFQLLAAVRQGLWGVEALNELCIQVLAKAQLIEPNPGQWFAGRPVLITRNDYGLRLMNGDVGLCLLREVQDDQGQSRSQLAVAFASNETPGTVRWLLPSRLQAAQTVLAMTVHKSQGSEFAHCALLLPDQGSPVLTRELLYTAVTRAKERFSLLTPKKTVLAKAMMQQVQRHSGLGL